MATSTFDYVILGNSAAGIAAAEAIRKADATGSILMVSPESYAAYGRPLISYLLEGKTSIERMSLRPETFYDDLAITTWFGAGNAAVSLDAAAHQVTLESGEVVTYGKLLAAMGSVPFTPPIKGLLGKTNMSTFLNLDSALTCCNAVDAATAKAHAEGRKSRVVVVGGGLIGLKAAEALYSHADDIVVLEMAPRILPAVLDAQGAAILNEDLAARGIHCMPGVTANEFVSEEDCIVSALLTNDTVLECDYVVAAVGVRPNNKLLEEAGAEIGRGTVINECLQTTLEDVYAAGDVTQTVDLLDGSLKPLALWPNAVRQGRLAGLHMAGAAGELDAYPGNFAVNAVDFFDITLLTAGIINPAPDAGYEENITVEGSTYTKFVTKDDCLYGYILLNRPDKAGIYTSLIDRKIPLSSLSEDIFSIVPNNMAFPDKIRWFRLHMGFPADRDHRGWKVQK